MFQTFDQIVRLPLLIVLDCWECNSTEGMKCGGRVHARAAVGSFAWPGHDTLVLPVSTNVSTGAFCIGQPHAVLFTHPNKWHDPATFASACSQALRVTVSKGPCGEAGQGTHRAALQDAALRDEKKSEQWTGQTMCDLWVVAKGTDKWVSYKDRAWVGAMHFGPW